MKFVAIRNIGLLSRLILRKKQAKKHLPWTTSLQRNLYVGIYVCKFLSLRDLKPCVHLVQLVEDAPLASVQLVIEELLADPDQNKQRAAAELLAGVIGGSKHWTLDGQQRLWDWFRPLMGKALGSNVKPDTLTIWTSFLEVKSIFFELSQHPHFFPQVSCLA